MKTINDIDLATVRGGFLGAILPMLLQAAPGIISAAKGAGGGGAAPAGGGGAAPPPGGAPQGGASPAAAAANPLASSQPQSRSGSGDCGIDVSITYGPQG